MINLRLIKKEENYYVVVKNLLIREKKHFTTEALCINGLICQEMQKSQFNANQILVINNNSE
jgi:hypothetical protein